MKTLNLKTINLKGGYKVELSSNQQGKPVASYSRLLSSGKNKGQYKRLDSYYYASEERREEAVRKFIDRVVLREQEKQNDIEAKKNIRQNMKHGFEVDQVLYSSWGYDQTNVDFYQVVEVSEKSIKIRSIGGEFVEGTEGHDYCNIRPVLNSFKDEKTETKIIQFYINRDQSVNYYVRDGRHSLSNYTDGERGTYCSWGR